jgi:hypothetical protein
MCANNNGKATVQVIYGRYQNHYYSPCTGNIGAESLSLSLHWKYLLLVAARHFSNQEKLATLAR